MRSIALITDFGVQDTYVGVMKGVMRDIHPEAQFIDITHAVAPQHVREAAFALLIAYSYFPAGTVFLVVVDPGVGSTRQPIAVQAGDYYFVAPDNGVLSYALAHFDQTTAVQITEHTLPHISRTFHGRDVFAPAAAHLAAGQPLASLGPAMQELVHLPVPLLEVAGRRVKGEVLHIDHFGNIITSIGRLTIPEAGRLTLNTAFQPATGNVPINPESAQVRINETNITAIQQAYADVRRGDLLALVGSSGFLEISVNQGNAADRLDAAVGDRVEISIGDIDAAIRN